MHQALSIREILLEIFGHCSPALESCNKADIVALAGTCRTFREPALDILWEELSSLSPLAQCLHEACCEFDRWGHSFSRPLSEAERNTLRGYSRRVWSISQASDSFDNRIVSTLASFTDPLFPNLRSLFWDDFKTPLAVHTAVPSLTSLYLSSHSSPDIDGIPAEFLDAFGECCPNMRWFVVYFPPCEPLDTAISRQLCRWTNLQHMCCPQATLSMADILYLPSMSTLTSLSFTLSADLDDQITHLGSVFIFSNLADLQIDSASLKSITNLFSRIQLPKINDLSVSVSGPRWDVREYWTAVQKACPFGTLARLEFSSSDNGIQNQIDLYERGRPWLTLDDLPCKDFGNLRRIDINLATWSVKLTDADLLDLVSTSPQLEELSINRFWGWKLDGDGGGITLSGLVQLLRQCPSLHSMSLVIDTRTFTKIPHGLDVSFPPRGTVQEKPSLNCLDSYFVPECDSDVKSVFTALGLCILSPGLGPRWF